MTVSCPDVCVVKAENADSELNLSPDEVLAQVCFTLRPADKSILTISSDESSASCGL